ncbi:hypothetical protein [Catellatospora tritici]|uniref:hypothetical protein n=1 Tax=Catellatospora tritici TaxID=2851566 RepID=UPI001C2CF85E|nr:hypothetical protein [Catellatospora tritici]MBV1853583.1 hypothetical protein [Catellatospora tritici]
MPHPRRRTVRLLLASALLLSPLAACKNTDQPAAAPSAVTVVSQSPAASPAAPKVPAPTCAEVRDAVVRGLIDPYYAFGDDGAPLLEGQHAGEDGLVLAVQQPCATGDLGGELGNVTVGTIMSSVVDTTGRYWAVMVCTKPADRAQCTVHFMLDDRDPIESVAIADHKLTLVYLTRPADGASAGVAVKRTAVYIADGGILKELSHTDEPYTP